MREQLLDYIVCPECQGNLSLDIYTRDAEHIMEGELCCQGCQTHYRVSEGIPILLNEHEIDTVNKTTAERFGQEWEDFDFIDSERYAKQFLDWIAPVFPEFFRGKIVLDAGCGKGRHCVASYEFQAKEVIGVDLANGSVRSAFRNTRHLSNVHILQANLYHLPFRQQTFDYVYSVGVLHHTPDPRKAFTSITKMLKSGGSVSAWVYGKEGNDWIVNGLNPVRKHITSKLPLSLLKWIAFLLAGILHFSVKCIYAPLNTYERLKPLSKWLFYNDYLFWISHFPFRENYSIVFDHLLPEIAFYISQDEFAAWFEENSLERVVITQKTNNSWRGTGEKL